MVQEDAYDIMKPQADSEETSVLKEAMDFLSDALAYGAKLVSKLKKEANEYGLSWVSVVRAKTALKIITQKSGLTGGWVWSLPNNPTANGRSKILPFQKSIQNLPKEIKSSEESPNTNSLISFKEDQASEELIAFEETHHFEQDLNKLDDKIVQNINRGNVVTEGAQDSKSLISFEEDHVVCEEGSSDHLRQNLNNSEEEDVFRIDVSDLLEKTDE